MSTPAQTPIPRPNAQKRTVSHGTSAVRLAMALRQMNTAETLAEVIAAKDRAKEGGLNNKDTEALRQAFASAKARFCGAKALPPAYDVMRAPPYVPPPAAAVRPGADDHLACKSHGHPC